MMDDGGPIFPSIYAPTGISLRDWLAGHALAGFAKEQWVTNAPRDIQLDRIRRGAEDAYAYADALLAEREKAK